MIDGGYVWEVPEKLQKTLETRLGESFRQVSERLEAVQAGLGEMRNLATGVGDLKKVLTNVKTRGTLGEIQLGAILEEILTVGQYDRNVQTKPDSRENVEYAVKLPGPDDEPDRCVWLPIDSKLSGLYIPVNLIPQEDGTSSPEIEYHYTIQLKAARMPILNSSFQDIKVIEYTCKDGYYRYTTSSFRTFREASRRLLILRKQGYPDAFIQTREWYEKAIR